MTTGSIDKSSYTRFCYTLSIPNGSYIACDLEESKLYYWADDEPSAFYWVLASSENEDEKNVFNWYMQSTEGKARCKGINLNLEEVEYIESLLTDENVEQTRLITEQYLSEKRGEWMGCDEWHLDFYLGGDSGKPPVCLNNIHSWTLRDDGEMFEQLLSWIIGHFHLWTWGKQNAGCWSKRMKDVELNKRVMETLEAGIEQIEDLLWNGKPKQMRLLNELSHKRPFWYTYDDCLTVRYGDEISRGRRFHEEPNCVKIFGNRYAFDSYKEFEVQ